MTAKKKTKPEPTAAEREAILAAATRFGRRPLRPEPKLSVVDGGALNIEAPHSDEIGAAKQVQDAFASASNTFVTKSLLGLVNTVGNTTDDIGHAMAIMAAVQPANELESVLAQQLAVSHVVSMKMAQRAQSAERLDAVVAYGNLATKFSRTFTAQVEALGKLRNGGAQVVKHVHVHEGGQAVVTEEVHVHGGGRNAETAIQPYGAGAGEPAAGPALPSHEPGWQGVPIAGSAGKARVPAARRGRGERSAQGE